MQFMVGWKEYAFGLKCPRQLFLLGAVLCAPAEAAAQPYSTGFRITLLSSSFCRVLVKQRIFPIEARFLSLSVWKAWTD